MKKGAARAPAPAAAPTRTPQPTAAPTAEGEAAQVARALGAGANLPASTRARMERAFGQPFGDVRVHTGDAAARATARHDAAALTVGRDVAFAPGLFRPGTPRGDHLIAHELAHVVQQAGAGAVAQARALRSTSSEGAEQQAEAAASRVSAGLPAGVARGGFALTTRARIMRRARALSSSLPAMTATPVVGGGVTPSRATLSPALTTRVSPAGGQAAGLSAVIAPRPGELRDASPRGLRTAMVARATAAVERQAAPDQAQTPIRDAAISPPSVMVAGAPAGATADGGGAAGSGERAGRDRQRDGRGRARRGRGRGRDHDREQGDARERAGGARGGRGARRRGGAAGGGGGRPRTRRFGHIRGDRGAGAARRALDRLERRASAQQHHEPAAQRVTDARRAVEPPPAEQGARAQGRQVAAVAAEPPPATDAPGARRTMEADVDAAAPRDMEEMSSYDPAHLRGRINRTVGAQVDGVNASFARVNTPGPAAPTAPPVPQPPPEPAPPTAAPASHEAVPPPVAPATLDASEYQEDADSAFAEHDVSERARQNSTEGPLHDMRQQEEGIDRAVETAGDRVREREAAARARAEGQLQQADEEAEAEMTSTRDTAQARVGGEQDTTRTGEQTDRQTVTEQIEGIYTSTATVVNQQLGSLTQQATERFDTGQAAHLEAFKRDTRRDIARFKSDRYSTPVVGWARWLKDRFVSINNLPRVKEIYRRNRDAYVRNITTLIDAITADADRTIAVCRLAITVARTAIDALVAAQPPRLRAEAEEAQRRVHEQFTQLERQCDQAAAQVRSALESRRERAMQAVDQALAEIQAENASLIDRLVAFVRAIVDALGQFFRLMVRIAELGLGTFLGRALDQASAGVRNHLWNELKQAFREWIFMKLAFLQPLLLLPSNVLEVLAQAAMNLAGLFFEALPEALPAIGVAAMTWLAVQLAAKLIPGLGAIMAVIDAIRAAWSLIQSLIRAASAFFQFLMLVAGGGDGSVQFARALAWGIIAAVDALLTFLGVDSLLRRIARPLGRPMGRIVGRLRDRFARRRTTRQARRRRRDDDDRRAGARRGDDHHRARAERTRARADRRAEARRARTTAERRSARAPARADARRRSQDPNRRRQDADRRRRQERERRNRERLERAVAAIRPRAERMLRDGVSERRMRMTFRRWQVRYRLTRLRMMPDGGIEAAINPRTVFTRARRVPAAELGRLLRPILAAAEIEYRRQRNLTSPQSPQNVDAASQRAGQLQPMDQPGAQLTRGERAEAFSRAPIQPSTDAAPQWTDVGGAMGRQRTRPGPGPQLPSMTLLDVPGHGPGTYPNLAPALRAMQRPGVRGRDLFAILAAPRARQPGMAAALGLSAAQLSTLQGMTALDDLERGRNPALGTANLVNRRLGAVGTGTLDEQYGDPRADRRTRDRRPGERTGATAPSTMTGAVSARQSRAEERRQDDRIGRIFQRLEATALRGTVVQAPAGSLEALARAVDRWLRIALANRPDRRVLEARTAELVAQLAALLASYD